MTQARGLSLNRRIMPRLVCLALSPCPAPSPRCRRARRWPASAPPASAPPRSPAASARCVLCRFHGPRSLSASVWVRLASGFCQAPLWVGMVSPPAFSHQQPSFPSRHTRTVHHEPSISRPQVNVVPVCCLYTCVCTARLPARRAGQTAAEGEGQGRATVVTAGCE